MKDEAEAGEVLVDIKQGRECVPQASGISKETVIYISKEFKAIKSGEIESFRTPGNSHCVSPTNVDDFDKYVRRYYTSDMCIK